MSKPKEFPSILLENIRKRGAMDKLVSDMGTNEISKMTISVVLPHQHDPNFALNEEIIRVVDGDRSPNCDRRRVEEEILQISDAGIKSSDSKRGRAARKSSDVIHDQVT